MKSREAHKASIWTSSTNIRVSIMWFMIWWSLFVRSLELVVYYQPFEVFVEVCFRHWRIVIQQNQHLIHPSIHRLFVEDFVLFVYYLGCQVILSLEFYGKNQSCVYYWLPVVGGNLEEWNCCLGVHYLYCVVNKLLIVLCKELILFGGLVKMTVLWLCHMWLQDIINILLWRILESPMAQFWGRLYDTLNKC